MWQWQNVAHIFGSLVWCAHATCHCDNSNWTNCGPSLLDWWCVRAICSVKPHRVSCMWFCHRDMSQRWVASCDRTINLPCCFTNLLHLLDRFAFDHSIQNTTDDHKEEEVTRILQTQVRCWRVHLQGRGRHNISLWNEEQKEKMIS